MQLRCGDYELDLSSTRVMGVLNVTPDSFSDGGRFLDPGAAVDNAHRMVEQGADIIDLGGESTRPGAEPVDEDAELDRILPVLERLATELKVPVSVDTNKPGVMRAAADAGASMLNDVCALTGEGALDAAVASGLPVCLMHMQGEPRNMQKNPTYDDVVADVRDYLAGRRDTALAAGMPEERIVLDPGFGFGKTLEHNLALLRHLDEFLVLGRPLLVGMSRKSMIGKILDKPVDRRVHGSVSAAVIAAWQGARIVRAHDVEETVDALRVCDAARTGLAPGDGG